MSFLRLFFSILFRIKETVLCISLVVKVQIPESPRQGTRQTPALPHSGCGSLGICFSFLSLCFLTYKMKTIIVPPSPTAMRMKYDFFVASHQHGVEPIVHAQ